MSKKILNALSTDCEGREDPCQRETKAKGKKGETADALSGRSLGDGLEIGNALNHAGFPKIKTPT